MPDPSKYDDESEWMEACMSAAADEGREHDQATAMCLQMWRDRNKKTAPKAIEKGLPQRAYSQLQIKAVDPEQRMIEGIASTPTVDRIGDIVEPLGAKFSLPMPLLAHHKHDQPVGQVIFAKPTKDGIRIKARLAKVTEPGPLKDRIDTAWGELKHGLVRGLSIGFSPVWDAVEMLESGGMRFREYGLHEISLVTIPANQDASINAIKSIDQNLQAAGQSEASGFRVSPTADFEVGVGVLGRSGAAKDTREGPSPGSRGKTSVNLKLTERRNMSKTIAEQVKDLEASRAAKAAKMSETMSKSMAEGRSTNEEEQELFDTLEREVEAIDADLTRLRKLEKAMSVQAVPVPEIKSIQQGSDARGGGNGGYQPMRISSPDKAKGIMLAQVARCLGLAQGNRAAAAEIAESMYSDDQRVVATLKAASRFGQLSDVAVTKAAVNAATTTENQWAGVLVQAATGAQGPVGDFLEFLRPQTILGRLEDQLRRVPFRTSLISQTSGGAAYWVAEAAAKPLTRFDLQQTTLLPTKVATIAVCTEELLRDSSPSADVLIRDTLAAALRERLDRDFIDPTSTASAAKPASITSAAVQVMSAGAGGAGTGTAVQVRTDIRALMAQFQASNLGFENAVWIMRTGTAMNLSLMTNALGAPDPLVTNLTPNGGTLMGRPVIISDFVPAVGSPVGDFVILLDTKSVWFADDGGLTVDMSREASLQMDDAATMTAGGSGASPAAPTATSVVSMWQANCVAFRAERVINWMVARPAGVAVLTGGNWGE
jgi:HK97 family phage major capsid protein/HK97 family phage prohead protease